LKDLGIERAEMSLCSNPRPNF